ncbi:efflux RND transporter periplasmic adaptor subunit [bacterium]|nr:efflux RND transporter periplasmic adaptor subunit [bacterium]
MNTAEKLRSLSIDRSAPSGGGAGPWPLIAGVAVVAMLAMAGWMMFMRPAPAPAPAVAAADPAAGAAGSTVAGVAAAPRPRGGLVASGYVVARRAATVSVDITGRLTDVMFEEGAIVEKGQLLAQLDDEPARYDLQLRQAQVQSAKANVQALEAQMVEAENQRQRAERLMASEAVSRAALDQAVATIESLKARYDAARADVRVAEFAVERQADFVDRHKVRAPFAGVIIAKNAQAGEILSPAGGGGEFTRTGVATLVDMASLEVEVDVNEGQISDVRPGQNATIVLDAYPDWNIPAEVIAIIPTANRDRATIQVRVGFKERDPRVLPQMAAKVTFDRTEG